LGSGSSEPAGSLTGDTVFDGCKHPPKVQVGAWPDGAVREHEDVGVNTQLEGTVVTEDDRGRAGIGAHDQPVSDRLGANVGASRRGIGRRTVSRSKQRMSRRCGHGSASQRRQLATYVRNAIRGTDPALSFDTERLSSNSDRLSFNRERLSSNSERLSSNSERLSSNSERLSSNSERLSFDRKHLSSNSERLSFSR
jgi:hypothetical protein